MIETLVVQAATGFGLGQLPFMPGTFGSLLGLPLAWWLLGHPPRRQALIAVILLVVAVPLCHWASLWLGGGDIPQIVADEYLVFPVSVMGLASMRRPWELLTAFVLFRLFDALKLPPLNFLEAVGGGLGIVLDDLMAAVYSWIVIAVAICLWRWFCKKQAI
ncbi:phosphatidylglycerophosphatase A [Ectopseudomonas alcaliphila JAB1]|nr:phosphatidylglycerophosphatase A [Pseudomonas alcaliphila]APU30729.1 phosphatidylglycerophosphatase A [Pseudomonas alcaliphila JAB1]